MSTTLIEGGTVYGEGGPERADVLIEGDRIARVGDLGGRVAATEVIDATGLHVLPGLIDFHVHLEDTIGRFSIADDFPSGTEAAVRSGITTIATFVTQRPGESLGQSIDRQLDRGRGRSHSDFVLHLTPTRFDEAAWYDIESAAARGFRTFKFYTTYRESGLFTEWSHLAEIFERLRDLDVRILVHCEDQGVLDAVPIAGLDPSDARSYTRARPEEAERVAVDRVVGLAESTGAKAHVVHVSTDAAARRIAEGRSRADVTCETAPHYLLLDDEHLHGARGRRFKCTPPLRRETTRAALEAIAADGGFDLLATDHCPFRRADKESSVDIFEVPAGLAGVGSLVPLAVELLVRKHRLGLAEVVRRLAENPARLLGLHPRKGSILPGADGDVVVLDLDGAERPVVSSLSDCFETYEGFRTSVEARYVFLRGKLTASGGVLVRPDEPRGRCPWTGEGGEAT